MNSFCRFGTSCRYSHRLPKEVEEQNKEIEEQNKKIESLREITNKLSKQVVDQTEEIKDLKRRLLETERDLQRLQKQIDAIVQSNYEKEKAIEKLKENENVSLEGAVLTNAIEENPGQDNVTMEEILVSEEGCEAEVIKKATIKYAHKCLSQVEKLEAEMKKIRKNANNLGTTLTEKSNSFFERLDEIEVNEELCEEVIKRILNLREFLSFSEKKPDKERNLRSIMNCKKFQKGYLKYPKRPSQIPLGSCCKVCLLSSKAIPC